MTEIVGLRELSTEQIVELANGVLVGKLGIDDPAYAAQRVVEIAGLNSEKVGEIQALAREAAIANPDELGEFLRCALNDLAESDPASRGAVQLAAEEAGQKQTIVGLDVLLLGYLALCGYMVIKNRGVESSEVTVKVVEQKDGRLEVTFGRTIKYINPLTPLGKLISSVGLKLGR